MPITTTVYVTALSPTEPADGVVIPAISNQNFHINKSETKIIEAKMTLKTTAAVLAALTFLATPITAQAQNTTTQTTPTIAAVDLAALRAKCDVLRARTCETPTLAALNAYLFQKPTPAQINAQVGLIAAMLITVYNANRAERSQVRFTIYQLRFYSSDSNQKRALEELDRLMADALPVTLNAFASALSPS